MPVPRYLFHHLTLTQLNEGGFEVERSQLQPPAIDHNYYQEQMEKGQSEEQEQHQQQLSQFYPPQAYVESPYFDQHWPQSQDYDLMDTYRAQNEIQGVDRRASVSYESDSATFDFANLNRSETYPDFNSPPAPPIKIETIVEVPTPKLKTKVKKESIETESGTTKAKRIQVKSACINCRKSCKKCSSSRPCERCVKNGQENSCIDVARRRRETASGYKKSKTIKEDPMATDQNNSFY